VFVIVESNISVACWVNKQVHTTICATNGVCLGPSLHHEATF